MYLWQSRCLRLRGANGQTHRSAPTVAAILTLEMEFVSYVRKRIGLTCHLLAILLKMEVRKLENT
jgi:hypothetical protein